MKTFSQVEMIPLEEILDDMHIFSRMSDLSFIPDATVASYLDYEYFLNRSGRKIASPLVFRLSDEHDYKVTIANIITNRYRAKWEGIFARYADFETLNLLNNINVKQETQHGHAISETGSDVITKSGTETRKYDGSEIHTENFPLDRKTTRTITGSYSDDDNTTTTRTGSQKVTDKGGTLSSSFGFNSNNPVPVGRVEPIDDAIGTTQETTYGENGLIDANSGSITRTYNNYKDELVESGSKQIVDTYGDEGKTEELSFDARSDSHSISKSISNSGKDTVTETGFRYRKDELLQQYLTLFSSASMIDFLEIVFTDVDEVLTLPIYG